MRNKLLIVFLPFLFTWILAFAEDPPFFTYREIYGPDARDPDFRARYRLDFHGDYYGKEGWVHTFQKLVPPASYFDVHQEYFSEVGGIRIPDGQLCLSNPEVLNVLVENLEKAWAKEPDARAWSVSQNDTYKNCECDGCRKLDSTYGGPSGTMIWFVNRVAEHFPEQEIATLAYQYTREAPKDIIPAGNVTVVLCTIECDRGAPIEEQDPSFVRDLEGWSRITSNILIWDYVVQFRNYLDPFPNFTVLQPNLQLFRKYGARKMFQQASGSSWSDMIELKQHLIAKLLWDPDLDVKAETAWFLNDYYGAAGPVIGKYLELLHKSLRESGGRLGIYGFPYDGFKTYLTPDLLDAYDSLWDEAELRVKENPLLLQRTQKSRLPVLFARLDIALHEPGGGPSWFLVKDTGRTSNPAMRASLDTLVERCNRFGITALDENGTTPEMYRNLVSEWLAKSLRPNCSLNKPVTLKTPASGKYPVGGAAALTDGIFGFNDYHFNWLGFEGNDLEAVIDLGRKQQVQEVSINFLQFNQAWIFLPQDVRISLSKDGINFTEEIAIPAADPPQKKGSFVQEFRAVFKGPKARYVKVLGKSIGVCPPWHGGHGLPCWIFADEINVR